MDSAENALSLLESFRRRKGMYLQPVSVETVQSFLTGFYLACMASGIVADWDAWNKVVKARGWDTEAACPIPAMRAAGMDDEAIMDELTRICQEAIVQSRHTP